jgi:hypothetical protein
MESNTYFLSRNIYKTNIRRIVGANLKPRTTLEENIQDNIFTTLD